MLKRNAHRRRGSATLWMVIWLPCLLVLFCVLARVANLWLARVELENALEAAALAAVKHWGDAGGGDTFVPREVGVAYAQANGVRSRLVTIGTNYDVGGGPNQNAQCAFTHAGIVPPTGNLIFGAIDHTNPDNVIFNAGLPPGCGSGVIVFDVTSSGELNDNQNEWGIAFHPGANTPAGLRIQYVLITIPAGQGVDQFETDFTLSPNDPGQFLMRFDPDYKQPDVQGFSDPAAQITASYPTPLQLRIDFAADPGGADQGFEPCDRIRFGNGVDFSTGANGLPGNLRDADGIGHLHTQFLVHFSDGSEINGQFQDNSEDKNDCQAVLSTLACPAGATDNQGNPVPRHYVHPTKIDDLPCPQTSPGAGQPTNNGQSYGTLSPAGKGKFGVRAQASIAVQPFLSGVFLGKLTEYCIQATTHAEYDCATRRVRLVHIDTFICPGPVDVAKKCPCSP